MERQLKGQEKKLTTGSLREELKGYLDTLPAGKQPTLAKSKGFIFRYFMASFGEKFGRTYRPGNRLADFGQIGHILRDWEGMTINNFFDIIDHYIEAYEGRWDKKGHKSPSIVFLKYVVGDIVSELAEAESIEKRGLDDLWI